MEQDKEVTKDKINWNVWIPVALWIGCVFLGIIKVLLDAFLFKTETEVDFDFINILNAFNSNTFSTFISIVVCKLYLYISTEGKGLKKEQVSGLSMRSIPAVIIISLIYLVVATFDTAINLLWMAIIFFMANVSYVLCFFKLFLSKKRIGGDSSVTRD